jgi:pimeloyl-ACP methyl ester carboxylesterase
MTLQTIPYQHGSSLSYTDVGSPQGFPILIQHGMIASIRGSQLFERLTSAGMRLISIARPGYGDSTPYEMKNIAEWGEIVAVLVDKLQLAQFDVLGISSGAPYSYAIGSRLPDKVRNLFIQSGTPALYDDGVLAHWPYPVNRQASLAELQKVAYELFFAYLSPADLAKDEIRDSMCNDCFGIAQDLKIRCLDWGFHLEEVICQVSMRHSRADESVPLITAEITAQKLPNCQLEISENDPHFSQEVIDRCIDRILAASR